MSTLPEPPKSYWLTILFGVLLIAIIAPLSQFLTIQTVNADIETATPVGWAVGLLFSTVLAFALLRLVARNLAMPRERIVLLFCMLTIAVPVMNLGLVRLCFLSMTAVAREYLIIGNSTYRTAYDAKNPAWYPVIPTRDGLAWNRADRLLVLLSDDRIQRTRQEAMRSLGSAINQEQERLASGTGTPPDAATLEALKKAVAALGPDECATLLAADTGAARTGLGIEDTLNRQGRETSDASARTAGELAGKLAAYDEFDASLLPKYLETADRKTADRVRESLAAMPEQERKDLLDHVAGLLDISEGLGQQIGSLSASDRERLRSELAATELQQINAGSEEEFLRAARSFVFRLDRSERLNLARQDGLQGRPNHNLAGMKESLWSNLPAAQAKRSQTLQENLQQLFQQLPWHLWLVPILFWSLLFTVIFLLLMCLAEWLRRKWVERENLAFPLVDIADGLIRHDFALETASSPIDPAKRARAFNPLFLIGAALAFLYVSAEAMGHYEITGTAFRGAMDVSGTIFSSGNFKELTGIFFVISPIVIGIAFLVNLEVSFSIWVSFVLFKLISWQVQLASSGEIRDALYTGWGGGRFYPFPMEQMLGATLCFSSVLLIKAWFSGRDKPADFAGNSYVGARLTRWGLIVLPLVVVGMLWMLGVRDALLLIVAGIVLLAQTIAAARARAETGLPTGHISYEFNKLPMIFGLTGLSGAKPFVNFIGVAFLPATLLFRTLPQQLENLELARRFKIRYGTVARASLVAFLTAIGVGMMSFLLFSYFLGETFYGSAGHNFGGKWGPSDVPTMTSYPLWISHFFGENGLDKFTQPHWIRVWFIGIGFGVVAALMFLRSRFLKFPINPIGYVVVLLSFHYDWVNPFYKGLNSPDTSWLWSSVLLAWLIKKLTVKYGGMNAYRAAKPFFIGLVVGAVFCVFAWNMLDLGCSISAENATGEVPPFLDYFRSHPPFSPRFY